MSMKIDIRFDTFVVLGSSSKCSVSGSDGANAEHSRNLSSWAHSLGRLVPVLSTWKCIGH